MTGETPNNGVYDDSDDDNKRKKKPNEGKSKTPVLDNFYRTFLKLLIMAKLTQLLVENLR
jgi:hypothetical protein